MASDYSPSGSVHMSKTNFAWYNNYEAELLESIKAFGDPKLSFKARDVFKLMRKLNAAESLLRADMRHLERGTIPFLRLTWPGIVTAIGEHNGRVEVLRVDKTLEERLRQRIESQKEKIEVLKNEVSKPFVELGHNLPPELYQKLCGHYDILQKCFPPLTNPRPKPRAENVTIPKWIEEELSMKDPAIQSITQSAALLMHQLVDAVEQLQSDWKHHALGLIPTELSMGPKPRVQPEDCIETDAAELEACVASLENRIQAKQDETVELKEKLGESLTILVQTLEPETYQQFCKHFGVMTSDKYNMQSKLSEIKRHCLDNEPLKNTEYGNDNSYGGTYNDYSMFKMPPPPPPSEPPPPPPPPPPSHFGKFNPNARTWPKPGPGTGSGYQQTQRPQNKTYGDAIQSSNFNKTDYSSGVNENRGSWRTSETNNRSYTSESEGTWNTGEWRTDKRASDSRTGETGGTWRGGGSGVSGIRYPIRPQNTARGSANATASMLPRGRGGNTPFSRFQGGIRNSAINHGNEVGAQGNRRSSEERVKEAHVDGKKRRRFGDLAENSSSECVSDQNSSDETSKPSSFLDVIFAGQGLEMPKNPSKHSKPDTFDFDPFLTAADPEIVEKAKSILTFILQLNSAEEVLQSDTQCLELGAIPDLKLPAPPIAITLHSGGKVDVLRVEQSLEDRLHVRIKLKQDEADRLKASISESIVELHQKLPAHLYRQFAEHCHGLQECVKTTGTKQKMRDFIDWLRGSKTVEEIKTQVESVKIPDYVVQELPVLEDEVMHNAAMDVAMCVNRLILAGELYQSDLKRKELGVFPDEPITPNPSEALEVGKAMPMTVDHTKACETELEKKQKQVGYWQSKLAECLAQFRLMVVPAVFHRFCECYSLVVTDYNADAKPSEADGVQPDKRAVETEQPSSIVNEIGKEKDELVQRAARRVPVIKQQLLFPGEQLQFDMKSKTVTILSRNARTGSGTRTNLLPEQIELKDKIVEQLTLLVEKLPLDKFLRFCKRYSIVATGYDADSLLSETDWSSHESNSEKTKNINEREYDTIEALTRRALGVDVGANKGDVADTEAMKVDVGEDKTTSESNSTPIEGGAGNKESLAPPLSKEVRKTKNVSFGDEGMVVNVTENAKKLETVSSSPPLGQLDAPSNSEVNSAVLEDGGSDASSVCQSIDKQENGQNVEPSLLPEENDSNTTNPVSSEVDLDSENTKSDNSSQQMPQSGKAPDEPSVSSKPSLLKTNRKELLDAKNGRKRKVTICSTLPLPQPESKTDPKLVLEGGESDASLSNQNIAKENDGEILKPSLNPELTNSNPTLLNITSSQIQDQSKKVIDYSHSVPQRTKSDYSNQHASQPGQVEVWSKPPWQSSTEDKWLEDSRMRTMNDDRYFSPNSNTRSNGKTSEPIFYPKQSDVNPAFCETSGSELHPNRLSSLLDAFDSATSDRYPNLMQAVLQGNLPDADYCNQTQETLEILKRVLGPEEPSRSAEVLSDNKPTVLGRPKKVIDYSHTVPPQPTGNYNLVAEQLLRVEGKPPIGHNDVQHRLGSANISPGFPNMPRPENRNPFFRPPEQGLLSDGLQTQLIMLQTLNQLNTQLGFTQNSQQMMNPDALRREHRIDDYADLQRSEHRTRHAASLRPERDYDEDSDHHRPDYRSDSGFDSPLPMRSERRTGERFENRRPPHRADDDLDRRRSRRSDSRQREQRNSDFSDDRRLDFRRDSQDRGPRSERRSRDNSEIRDSLWFGSSQRDDDRDGYVDRERRERRTRDNNETRRPLRSERETNDHFVRSKSSPSRRQRRSSGDRSELTTPMLRQPTNQHKRIRR